MMAAVDQDGGVGITSSSSEASYTKAGDMLVFSALTDIANPFVRGDADPGVYLRNPDMRNEPMSTIMQRERAGPQARQWRLEGGLTGGELEGEGAQPSSGSSGKQSGGG
jgi:hypothetical protein